MATISSVSAGMPIAITEASGIATYTLVHHNYNDGVALLLRSASIGTSAWRSTAPSSSTNNIFQGSTLDNYLINWGNTLPSETTQYLVPVSYPVTDANYDGNKVYISRLACTISAAETSFADHANWQDIGDLDYSNSLSLGSTWWTRQPSAGTTYAYSIDSDGSDYSTVSVTYSRSVRPTLGVSEDQYVEYDSSRGAYVLATETTTVTQLDAPTTLYLDSGQYNYGQVTPGSSYTLSWDAVAGASGYGVYYSTSENGTYTLLTEMVNNVLTVYAPDTYSTYRYFRVKTLGNGTTSLDSELSTSYRSLWTAADPANVCTAPSTLYLDDVAADMTNATPGATHTLSWTAGTGTSVSGYYVYYQDPSDTYKKYLGYTTSQSMEVTAPSTYVTTRAFYVMTCSSILGADSAFSSARSITTKAETVNYGVSYYDGTQWLYPIPWYYNGSAWVRPTMWYYDGSAWLPIPPLPDCSYTVEAVSGAAYGFALNSDGYYQSQNAGVINSCALCKVKVVTDGTKTVYFKCKHYGEGTSSNSYDYGMLSYAGSTFDTSPYTDESANTMQSFAGLHSELDTYSISYGQLPAGTYYIYAKYVKDSSNDMGSDSLQFKVYFE